MSEDNQQKSGMSGKDKLLVLIAGLVILLVIVISVVMIISTKQQEAQQKAEQESIRISQSKASSRSRPKFSSYNQQNTASISKSEAQTSIADAITAGFEAMQKLDLVSGQSADVSSLPKETKNKVYSAFTSDQVFQDFNDNLNVSVEGGQTIYGDANAKNHILKRPEPGTPYYVDKADVSLKDTSSTEYTFEVTLTYHPKGFSRMTQKLLFQVDRSVGKVSSVTGE